MTTYFVMPGEMLSGIVLDPPDTELVAFGGTAVDTTIHGGIQDDAGAATGTTIYTGYQYVEPGGVASNTMMYGGAEFVFAAARRSPQRSMAVLKTILGRRSARSSMAGASSSSRRVPLHSAPSTTAARNM